MAAEHKQKLNRLRHQAVRMLFPEAHCPGCGKRLWQDEMLCPECAADLAARPRCEQCDCFIAAPGVCLDCSYGRPPYPRAVALPYEGKVREGILALKYDRDRSLLDGCARLLLKRVRELGLPFDVVIGVPLHKNRRRERGYDQAVLLARAVAYYADVPCVEDALVRVVDTKPQHSLKPGERQENMREAFAPGLGIDDLKDKTVLLVDDIITTGATINAAAAVLQQGGCKGIVYGAMSAPVRK